MISDIFRWFSGFRNVEARAEYAASVCEILNKCRVRFKTVGKPDEYVRFRVYKNDPGSVTELLDNNSIPFTMSGKKGFPAVLSYLRSRPGLCVGFLLFSALNFYLSRVVWNITVTGNESMTEEEIVSILDGCGFTYGTYIPQVDYDALNSKIMATYIDVAWISVNMEGTTAAVQIREAKHGEENAKPENVYSNIVANEDGQIYEIFVDGGSPAVAPGDIVKKGDLLVSGVIPLRDGGVRFSYPSGEVRAIVERKVTAQVERDSVKTYYTGRYRSEYIIKIFNFSINLFSNGRIEYANYDKIDKNARLYIFGLIPLPVWINEVRFRESASASVRLSSAEALAQAESLLRRESDAALENCELLKKTVSFAVDDNCLSLEYRYIVLADIANIREFELSPD